MGLVLAAALPLALFVPAQGSVPRKIPVVNLVINGFRFCRAAPCRVQDTAYIRSPAGGSLFDNPSAAISVKAGSYVRWTYKDTGTPGCDEFNLPAPLPNCPGHEVRFENGTQGGGKQIGFARARTSTPQLITFYVPRTYAGRTLYYFCNINNHWAFGLTGILKITK
jgi:hypothetical protein